MFMWRRRSCWPITTGPHLSEGTRSASPLTAGQRYGTSKFWKKGR